MELEDALDRTWDIAQRCQLKLEPVAEPFPKFPIPENHTTDTFFEYVARQGFEKRRPRLEALAKQVALKHDIAEYVEANQFNHDRKRPRKLLLHRREIKKFASKAYETGLTLVPLKMYFKNGRVKVALGVGKAKVQSDKREDIKRREADREMKRETALRLKGR